MQENQSGAQAIQLGNDRQIAYCEYGDPKGKPVFYFHGTPGSRYEALYSDQAGREYGYRILALDRPGIGCSDYIRGRRLLDWPQDACAVAEQLEIERFGVIGVSGGGPYALACGHVMPERLAFTILMGSWGPVAEEPALWKEMASMDRFFGQLSRVAPWAFYLPFELLGYAAKKLSPQGFIKGIKSSLSEADKELLRDEEMARFFAKDVREAFRQGVRGPADDALILYSEWGFKVEEIEAKVDLYHGTEDKFAPMSYAMYLDEKLPCSSLHIYPEEGHLFVMKLFGEVLEQVSD
jgi:pimeloyl-ACP methyl ester carboxylesterase